MTKKKIMKKLFLALTVFVASFNMYAQSYNDFMVFVGNVLLNNKNYSNDEICSLYNQHYGISQQKLYELYNGFSRNWGDVVMGLELSQFLNKPINTIFNDYRDGGATKGWGNLAKQYGIKPGSDEFHRFKQRMKEETIYWKNTHKEYKSNKNLNVAGKNRRSYPNELIEGPLFYHKQKVRDNKKYKNNKNYKEKEYKSKENSYRDDYDKFQKRNEKGNQGKMNGHKGEQNKHKHGKGDRERDNNE